MSQEKEPSGFAERIAKLMERVEYRRADTIEDKQAIFRMRHEAYTREGYIEPNPSGLFTDPDDHSPNAWLIAVFIDGEIASSLRLHLASRPEQRLPAMTPFPDILGPRLLAGDVIVDATRHTSNLRFTRLFPQLPYITMRAAFLAEDYFGADFITAALRVDYQGVFRRMYGATTWAEPRVYPPMQALQTFMAYDCVTLWRATRERYPFIVSTPAERRALFACSSNGVADRDIASVERGEDRRLGRRAESTLSTR